MSAIALRLPLPRHGGRPLQRRHLAAHPRDRAARHGRERAPSLRGRRRQRRNLAAHHRRGPRRARQARLPRANPRRQPGHHEQRNLWAAQIPAGDRRAGQPFAYYETAGGGMGGRPDGTGGGLPGISGVHTHMSNTRNTPVEALRTGVARSASAATRFARAAAAAGPLRGRRRPHPRVRGADRDLRHHPPRNAVNRCPWGAPFGVESGSTRRHPAATPSCASDGTHGTPARQRPALSSIPATACASRRPGGGGYGTRMSTGHAQRSAPHEGAPARRKDALGVVNWLPLSLSCANRCTTRLPQSSSGRFAWAGCSTPST